MKVVDLADRAKAMQDAEVGSDPSVGTTYPPGTTLALTKAHLESMGVKNPQVGHEYEISGKARMTGHHEEHGAQMQMTHMGVRRLGKAAHKAMYGGEE